MNGVKPDRDGRVPLDSVVQRLRVGSVVEGTVQEAGGRLRIGIRLIDANQMRQLGSKRLEESGGNLFALLDQVTRSVADFLRSRLDEEIRLQQRRAATRSAAALDLVLRAEKARDDATRVGAGGTALAGRLLASADSLAQRAAAEDPKWSEPITQRGWVALARATRASTADAERQELAEALRLADRALELRADDPSALELRGTVLWT